MAEFPSLFGSSINPPNNPNPLSSLIPQNSIAQIYRQLHRAQLPQSELPSKTKKRQRSDRQHSEHQEVQERPTIIAVFVHADLGTLKKPQRGRRNKLKGPPAASTLFLTSTFNRIPYNSPFLEHDGAPSKACQAH